MPMTGRALAAVVSLALVAACSSEPTSAPSSPLAAPASAPSADLLGGLVGGVTSTVNKLLTAVVGVQRNTPLASSITVTKTIGSAGESVAAGTVFTVPALLFLSGGENVQTPSPYGGPNSVSAAATMLCARPGAQCSRNLPAGDTPALRASSVAESIAARIALARS